MQSCDRPTTPRLALGDWRPYGLAALGLIGLLLYILLWSPNFTAEVPGGDYLDFYMAGRILRDGDPARFYDFAYQLEFQNDSARFGLTSSEPLSALYIYPPFFAWFCLPFTYLPFREGAAAWALLMTACLIAAVWLTVRSLELRPPAFAWALLASLFFAPALISIYSCQNATLSLLILSATFFLLRRGQPFAAGAVFALLAFKPQLGLVITGVMLWKRQWSFLLGALLIGLAVAGACMAVSPAATLDYLRLGPTLSRWIDLPNLPLAEMSSWRGFWRLLLTGRSVREAELVSSLCSLATIALMVWALRGRPCNTADVALAFAVVLPATVLVSPHLLAYDLTLLLLPMTIALGARPVPRDRARDPLWLASAVLYLAAGASRWVAEAVGLQIVVPVVFLYIGVVGWVMRRELAGAAPHRAA